MNSIILEGAVVEEMSVVAAGSVVPPGRRIPSYQIWAGNPAKFKRELTKPEVKALYNLAVSYHKLAQSHYMEFQTICEAYKEVMELIEKQEKYLPEETEYPEPHWNVWKEIKSPRSNLFWKNREADRDLSDKPQTPLQPERFPIN